MPGLPTTPARLFDFVGGDPETNRIAMERGHLPWWTAPDLRIGFFRPLAATTHWLDYALWPDRPGLMHLQSLAWLALVVLVATVAYRRFLVPPSTLLPPFAAGLAATAFALDDAHSLPAGWLANRYALLCLFFGLSALVLHDRWRRGSVAAAWLAAGAFALALSCGELALSTGAYLLAYAVFLDHGRWTARLGALAPYVLIGAVWTVVYKAGGYGARGSAAYVDPVVEPLRFAAVAAERAPLLLAGQWWFPPSDFYNFLSAAAAPTAWWTALGLVVVTATVVWRAVMNQPAARFFALGMVLSVLPVSAMHPSDRLLAFVGFGAMGLLALTLGGVLVGARRGLIDRSLAVLLALVHFVLAPLMLYAISGSLPQIEEGERRIVASLPKDVSLSSQHLLFVDVPDVYKTQMPLIAQALRGDPLPRRALVLGAGIYPVRVERADERTLVLRPAAGFLAPRGTGASGYEGLPASFSDQYLSQMTNRLFRSEEEPFLLGQRIDLDGVSVVVTELMPDGRPAEAAFLFEKPLEDASYRWLRWDEDRFVPFTPPAMRDAVILP